jgi:hypothetical protein
MLPPHFQLNLSPKSFFPELLNVAHVMSQFRVYVAIDEVWIGEWIY